jgi:hypothetical protein
MPDDIERKGEIVRQLWRSPEGPKKFSMACHSLIRSRMLARVSRPLCERTLHPTLVQQGKSKCPVCEITMISAARVKPE